MFSGWALKQFGKRMAGKWDTNYQPAKKKRKGGQK